MDVIKMEPEVDALPIQTSDSADIEGRKLLSEEGNLLDLHVTEIKTEYIDHRYDVGSEIAFEETAVPIDFLLVKSEAEENSCELDQVEKEVKLEITVEEDEVITESVAAFCENIPQEEDVDTDGKKYDCDVCGMCFPDFARLKNHGLVHKVRKRFYCEVCGKWFSHPGNFNVHSRIHRGEKPFSCDVCAMCFSSFAILQRHSRVHTGAKPFSCDMCGKCFPYLSRLKSHSRLHTGERPFCSDVCGKSFSRLEHLKRHSRVHTGAK
ncbi:gastrula zinc finger protein XlCGF67.1-like isoform X2 [Periplaneta americana]|uniref:gastrula zinc finger protein XlCGF67.1-like isoform X2 n=1 Tax=Periplaneta americana TaxID=6978 RepID=UPI0037E95F27